METIHLHCPFNIFQLWDIFPGEGLICKHSLWSTGKVSFVQWKNRCLLFLLFVPFLFTPKISKTFLLPSTCPLFSWQYHNPKTSCLSDNDQLRAKHFIHRTSTVFPNIHYFILITLLYHNLHMSNIVLPIIGYFFLKCYLDIHSLPFILQVW